MVTSANPRPHGGVRGANLSRASLQFAGPFGRMFRALPPADYGVNDVSSEAALMALGQLMVSPPDTVKDGPDPEESGIPAVFTYFGQFIDHDLTFDPASSLQKQNDPEALVDYRTPRFDLDNVYGRGPDDQPYLYRDGRLFNVGSALSGAAANPFARDLPRSSADPARAIIGDPRNDENMIVSQLQGLMHRFHNSIAVAHADWPFDRVQREVRFHYQWIVLNDFLPRIVHESVLRDIFELPATSGAFKANLRFYNAKHEAFMPLEFSAAAYRFGHSMVRPGYRLSENIAPLAIFASDPNSSLTGFRSIPSSWAIDWNLFVDIQPRDQSNATRTQLAYRIDTAIVDPLGNLPLSVANDPPPSLAQRNLLRGFRMRLPSGQSVARAMGIVPLSDEQILIGQFDTGTPADVLGSVVDKAGVAFADNCPLWTYVLAETIPVEEAVETLSGPVINVTRKLGPVGGRIVAETMVGIMLTDSSSFISQDPNWRPSALARKDGVFGLRELIQQALAFQPM